MKSITYSILLTSLISTAVEADTLILADGTRIENVYVNETDSLYYAADPNTGTVVPHPKDGTILEKSDDRDVLREAWKSARTPVSQPLSAAPPLFIPDEDTPPDPDEPKPEIRTIRGTATAEVRALGAMLSEYGPATVTAIERAKRHAKAKAAANATAVRADAATEEAIDAAYAAFFTTYYLGGDDADAEVAILDVLLTHAPRVVAASESADRSARVAEAAEAASRRAANAAAAERAMRNSFVPVEVRDATRRQAEVSSTLKGAAAGTQDTLAISGMHQRDVEQRRAARLR